MRRLFYPILFVLLPRIQSFFKIGGLLSSSSKTNTSLAATMSNQTKKSFPIYIDESVMSQKAHGTCEKPVMVKLRWNCDRETADRICCFNRHYAEYSVSRGDVTVHGIILLISCHCCLIVLKSLVCGSFIIMGSLC
jgi:hypothetical protein